MHKLKFSLNKIILQVNYKHGVFLTMRNINEERFRILLFKIIAKGKRMNIKKKIVGPK